MAPDTIPYALCGRVTGAHGVRGWVKLHSHTSPIENILNYAAWQLRRAGRAEERALEAGRRQGRTVAAKLGGVEDRDAALALRGAEIWIDTAQFAALPAGEYYHHQLLGLAVVDQHGWALGRVAEILETGANDVLVVAGEEELLIPYVAGETVLDVDLAAGRIRMRWDGVL